MTEDEAAKKKCHVTFTRAGSIGERGQEETCMGSACMAWRWMPPRAQWDMAIAKPLYDPPYGPWEKAENGWVSKEAPNEGYCGLAGQP